ncbi:hypothetical protein EKD04_017585 [Chloroflexales bacterium ZM16-3]|nr:hypothetical protein [Chloroflexales bacterium ZM16-3]
MAITSLHIADFNGNQAEVLMVTASKGVAPRFDILFNGQLADQVPATSAWRAEQKLAIAKARVLVGLPEVEDALTPAPAAAPWAPTSRRQAKMALMYAENAREAGATDSPNALLAKGREHAAVWAGYGREAFNHEFDRLVVEGNELCEDWDLAAREKVIVY